MLSPSTMREMLVPTTIQKMKGILADQGLNRQSLAQVREQVESLAAQKLLDAAHEFWSACHAEGQYGAVQWLTGTTGLGRLPTFRHGATDARLPRQTGPRRPWSTR